MKLVINTISACNLDKLLVKTGTYHVFALDSSHDTSRQDTVFAMVEP